MSDVQDPGLQITRIRIAARPAPRSTDGGRLVKVSLFRLTSILLLTLVCCLPAFAQGAFAPRYREWEASGYIGSSFIDDVQFGTQVSGTDQENFRTVGLHYTTSYQVGMRVTQNVDNLWAATLEYNFANQPLRFTNLSPDIQSLSLSHYLHRFFYNVSYLPLPPEERFRPYITAGAGAALFYIPEGSKEDALELGVNLRDSWKFTLNWGGGFKYLIDDPLAITFDLKDQMSHVPTYGLPRSTTVVNGRYSPGFDPSGLLHNWQFQFGFAVQID
jgi:opacity protein-like surface antigen